MTKTDEVQDPLDAWCGWPHIHGPHEVGGRLCSGVMWSNATIERWAKNQAIEASKRTHDVRPEFRDEDR